MRSLYLSPQSCKSPHWWCSPRSTQTRSRTASRDEWLPNTTNNRRQSRRASNCCNRATRAAVSTASRTTTSSLQRFRTAVSSKEQRERSKVVASSTSFASSFFDCVFVYLTVRSPPSRLPAVWWRQVHRQGPASRQVYAERAQRGARM